MKTLQRFALTGLLLLSACGFSPIYGTTATEEGPVAEALSDIYINTIPNESGQKLRNRLMDRMYRHGRPKDPEAKLAVSLKGDEEALGIQKDATSTISELKMTADYKLIDRDGVTLLSGRAVSTVLYNKLDAQFGTLAAQRNAYDRAINEVGEQIVNRLGLYYAQPVQDRRLPAPDPSAAKETPVPEASWSLRPRPKAPTETTP